MFDVKVILDSKAPCGRRLTTIQSTFPRIILSEVNTHRDRARNAASSRAIPFMAMSESITAEPFIPIKWGMEQTGMQTGDEIPEKMRVYAEKIWLETLEYVNAQAMKLHHIGQTYWHDSRMHGTLGQLSPPDELKVKIHKSIPNRLLEPWMWCTQVMSATEWANFFRLRCHGDAEVHFQKIAVMIREALAASTPTNLKEGEWHLPYVTGYDYDDLVRDGFKLDQIKMISVARNARVSYLTQDKVRDPIKDIILFDRLVQGSGFGHWSAHEHVAQALAKLERSGPYVGFKQFRKDFPLECAIELGMSY